MNETRIECTRCGVMTIGTGGVKVWAGRARPDQFFCSAECSASWSIEATIVLMVAEADKTLAALKARPRKCSQTARKLESWWRQRRKKKLTVRELATVELAEARLGAAEYAEDRRRLRSAIQQIASMVRNPAAKSLAELAILETECTCGDCERSPEQEAAE